MSITEYYSVEDEKEFGHGTTFVISDHIFIFDRRLAHAINHIYNHLQILINLAGFSLDVSDSELKFLVSNHPFLRKKASVILSKFSKPGCNHEKMDSIRLSIVRQLTKELIKLIDITSSLAWEIDHENEPPQNGHAQKHSTKIESLEAALSHIPFIDFHSQAEERPSIVKYQLIE